MLQHARLASIIALSAALLTLAPPDAAAQIATLDGAWSFFLNISSGYPISPSMRANGEEMALDILGDTAYTTMRYPFGDPSTTGYGWGGDLAYRFPGSAISAMAGLGLTTFIAHDAGGQQARMSIRTFSLAGEYALGGTADRWNTFVRAGVNLSLIGGDIRYVDTIRLDAPLSLRIPVDIRTEVPTATRLGIQAEFGGRINLSGWPLSVEASAIYTNANLIGRSYTPARRGGNVGLAERGLNDGADPDNPSDQSRTIDFLALRGGIRLWF